MDQARLDEIEAILEAGGPWFQAGGEYKKSIVRADDGSWEFPFYFPDENPARQVDGPGIIRELVKRVRELEGGEEPAAPKEPDLMMCPACRGDGFARGSRPGPCLWCEGKGKVLVERTKP